MSTSQPRDFAKKQKQLRADTAERLEAIVEAAERAAETVINDAEAQARQYLAQARAEADRAVEGRLTEVSELIETLLGQATLLRQEAERLQATLEEARARIGSGEAVGVPSAREAERPAPTAPRLRAVAQGEEPGLAAEATRDNAAGARLLATQLAVSGSSREEIAARLRTGFEIEDTGAILDAILGPEE